MIRTRTSARAPAIEQATRYLRLPFDFDPARLEQDLGQLHPDEWIDHYNRRVHQRRWSCLPLRSVDGRADHIMASLADNFLDTPVLARCPYFQYVLNSFHCEKTSVRLMALEAGGRILPHTDAGGGFEDGVARIHIPIISDAAVIFTIDGEDRHFSAGAAWYMNANCLHAVHNGGKRTRIHLVLDCTPNAWLRRIFTDAGWRATPPPKYGTPDIHDGNVAAIIAGLRARGDHAALAMAARLEEIASSKKINKND